MNDYDNYVNSLDEETFEKELEEELNKLIIEDAYDSGRILYAIFDSLIEFNFSNNESLGKLFYSTENIIRIKKETYIQDEIMEGNIISWSTILYEKGNIAIKSDNESLCSIIQGTLDNNDFDCGTIFHRTTNLGF